MPNKKTTQDKAQFWLNQNHPKYEILEWGGDFYSYSLFLDKERGVHFKKRYSRLRESLKKNPDIIFSPTSKEKGTKIKQGFIKKYGVENISQLDSTKKKKEQTCSREWGGKTNLQNKEQKEKIRQTNLEKYGVENVGSSPQIKKRREETIKKKWGTDNVFKLSEFQKKAFNTKVRRGQITVLRGRHLRSWGEDPSFASPATVYKQHKKGRMPWATVPYRSNLELDIRNFLKTNLSFREISSINEVKISTDFLYNRKLPEHKGLKKDYKMPDFCFPLAKIIIEVDGEYWHQDFAKDKKRNETYLGLGYNLIIFKGEEVVHDFDGIASTILNRFKKGNQR